MERFLSELLYMSVTAAYLVVIVLVIRLLLMKAPKWIRVILWGIVGIRLMLPLRIESVFSLIPRVMTQKTADMPAVSAQVSDMNTEMLTPAMPVQNVGAEIAISGVETVEQTAGGMQWEPVLLSIWVAGFALMLFYCVYSYVRLSLRMREAVQYGGAVDGIYQSEKVESPFVLGIIKPRIYIPFLSEGAELDCVIAHEKAHIARKDHLVKLLAFLLLAIHWFNPLIWVAYILLCRDIELACDEKAIRALGEEHKKVYSQALLKCSVSRRSIAACPIAFGETGVKGRIKNVLHYKKPAFWIVLVSLLLCSAVAVCFLTNPREKAVENEVSTDIVNEEQSDSEESFGQEDSQEPVEEPVAQKKECKPPAMYLQDALSSSINFFEVTSLTYNWTQKELAPGADAWEAWDENNTIDVSAQVEGLLPVAAVKGKEWITLSDDIGIPYIASYGETITMDGLVGFQGEEPDTITVSEYDLLDFGDIYAEPISQAIRVENSPITLLPRRIYEVVAEWDVVKYNERGYYGTATYCFATSDQIGKAPETDAKEQGDIVVFDALIKERMVDTKDRICVTSGSDEYPGAFVIIIPETLMDKNDIPQNCGLIRITARETGETDNGNMKVLEAVSIRISARTDNEGEAFQPDPENKVEYEVNQIPGITISMDKYKSWEGEVVLWNQTEKMYEFGDWFEIQYKAEGAWYRVPMISWFAYHDIAWMLPADEAVPVMINWQSMYGELPVGTYRIVKSVSEGWSNGENEVYYLADEFEIMPSEG